MKKPIAQVLRTELTFEERYRILRRLRFWGDLFGQQADTYAEMDSTSLAELTKGLEEKRLVPMDKDAADTYEQKLMNTKDAVELWRFAKGLENHRRALLRETEQLFPEQKERLKYFHITNFKAD
ncbi:MAG TPA: hypothetical protein VN902_03025 [Candidatus Acidoferrales bacterium]|nr:hypothetical protein [Candidatus Acidoferrales bacterium]